MDSWTHGLMGSYEKLELYYNWINFDVKGTFYFKYILAQNTLQEGKS